MDAGTLTPSAAPNTALAVAGPYALEPRAFVPHNRIDFARALAHAADRGVEVTVLYDAMGSWATHRGFFRAMRRRGIKARAFNPLWPWPGLLRLFRRDHRKLLVADGEVAFVGGINISDEWAPVSEGGRNWRDDVMRIEGPVVAP